MRQTYQLNVNIFLAIVKLSNDGKHKTAAELSSGMWRQFTEQHIISSGVPSQIPHHLTANNYIAPGEHSSSTVTK